MKEMNFSNNKIPLKQIILYVIKIYITRNKNIDFVVV